MGVLTKTVQLYLTPRQHTLDKHFSEPLELQQSMFSHLLEEGRKTEYGQAHRLDQVNDYESFVRQIPLNTYEELKGEIDRMRHGESNVLWPGSVRWYAKSSGTTNDKSKFIPVSKEGLRSMHYQGGHDACAFYFRQNPKSRIFDGKGLILGGSHAPNYNLPHSLVGDLSAILMENLNPMIGFFRVPKKSVALMADFETKRDIIARTCQHENITNLSGVPSWMLSVLVHMLQISGKDSVEQLWPNLEVFFHGGIAFTPYRKQYEEIIRKADMHYVETYNASEGFFGVQNDPADKAMLLMLDYGTFYEFIPMDEYGKENPTVVPLSQVKTGVNYAMVITTTCGLWRYIIGDTVMFTQTNPYKFIITGRTKYFINAFGEELIQDNTEQALDHVCRQTGAKVSEYTVAPVNMDSEAHCRHQWIVEFAQEPDNLEAFADLLDQRLQQLNSDYEAKRDKNITMQRLELIKAPAGLFNQWLKSKGKLGGQHKVPRLSNSRDFIEELLKMMNP